MASTNQINAAVQQIKNAGYLYSKDALGVYFDNGTYRFSIIYHGPGYLVFINKKQGTGYKLVRKSDFMLNFLEALNWLIEQFTNV